MEGVKITIHTNLINVTIENASNENLEKEPLNAILGNFAGLYQHATNASLAFQKGLREVTSNENNGKSEDI